jgi:NAD(P)-dependent dehydrogenase (short-subunit alcohol dehydrogenase family)
MPSTLITGANRGLGLEFARQYLADGWQVYATCRDPESASELRRLADASDHKLRTLALDVTDPASVKTAAMELDGQAIDHLLSNAGVGGARGQTIGNIDYEAWAKVLDVNTMGPCGFQRHLLSMCHAASVSLSSPLPAVWGQLPTILPAARSPIAARRLL